MACSQGMVLDGISAISPGRVIVGRKAVAVKTNLREILLVESVVSSLRTWAAW